MKKLPLLFFALSSVLLHAQVNYTANDKVVPYTGKFRMGINMGYYPGWDNKTLADIAAGNPQTGQLGVGARGNRTGLYEIVLDYYGYGLVEPDMAHWQSLGMGEFTAILGGPAPTHQDYSQHCPGQFSSMFANLYTPVWDGGLNGTPYNDNNYWAAYVYKAASRYKDQVRFWEIWNEPGFDLTGNLGWRNDQYPNNWWKEGPNPCDYILRAPIYHYIRTLRVAYDVIKTVDPDGYVCLGSVGYQSLLNAILSNTDNPSMGDISADYPLTGGAYFDCISFHSYPHFDGSTTNYGLNIFRRHSDAAADGLNYYRGYYQEILDKYGYDGKKYPQKEWIVTEINSPRKAYSGPFFGGKEAQINHIMKAFMVGKIDHFNQLHTFQLSDQRTEAASNYEFHQMGLYQTITGGPYSAVVNDEGKALKTMTDLIYNTEYDAAQTAAMNLPAGVRGYAWKRPDGTYIYSLWARTTVDLSEAANANYSFPASFNLNKITKYTWDYGYTGTTQGVNSQGIVLDARPVFFTANEPVTACTLSAAVSPAVCNDNGTPANPADDTYTFNLTVNGSNTSGSWSTLIGGKVFSGTVGVAKNLGPFNIAQGGVSFIVRDQFKDLCEAAVNVSAPATCSNGGTMTTGVYCASKGDFPWHEWIEGVAVAGLKSTSGKSQYSDFTAQTAVLAPGSSNPITLTAGFSWFTQSEYWRVWVDLDKNGKFEATEIVFQGQQPKPADGTLSAAFNGTLTIPAGVAAGTTRMRVSMKRDAYADPCETFANGETEDYTVRIDGTTTGGGGGGGGTTTTTPNCATKSDFPWHEWISNVQIANISQKSDKAPYTLHTATANLKAGTTYPLTLTTGFSWFAYEEYWKVWIDYDRDGLLEEPGELAFSGQLAKPADGTPEAKISGSFTVPAGTAPGTTRMRVSMKRGAYASPCEVIPFGEVEDYTVVIEPSLRPVISTASKATALYDLSLYPNPASHSVMVNLNEYAGMAAKIYLLDALGRVVKTADLGAAAPLIYEISLEGVPAGQYFVQLRAQNQPPVMKKLTVE